VNFHRSAIRERTGRRRRDAREVEGRRSNRVSRDFPDETQTRNEEETMNTHVTGTRIRI
jgi:hypothetical protein